MRDILTELKTWRARGARAAVATVVEVRGSAPRPLGSKMAVSSAGEVAGSVSGGCVEAAVHEAARDVLASGRPRLLRFGISNEQAWSVGLMCGGTIEVLVEPYAGPAEADRRIDEALEHALEAGHAVALARLLSGPAQGARRLLGPGARRQGELGSAELGALVDEHAARLLEQQRSERLTLEADGRTQEVFVEVHAPPPKLVILGAVHIAAALVQFARLLGFRTVVVDPRTAFAAPGRFAQADELLVAWPDEAFEAIGLDASTYVVVLSHDPKLDQPALEIALRSEARYVGAIGSRRTQHKRLEALRDSGLEPGQLARLHSPVGLELGGKRAEEIALAIAAEMIAVRNGARLPRAAAGPAA